VGLIIYIDGGARGNPGPAGAGVVIRDDQGRLIYEAGYFLGRQTNNAAEYHALIRGLERAARLAAPTIAIYSDSELLVRQITGEYQVKSAKLAPLHQQVQVLLIKSGRWTIRHVSREQNLRADELANLAMDRRQDLVVFDADRDGDRGPQPVTAPAADQPPPPAASQPAQREPASDEATRAVRVCMVRPPKPGGCPSGDVDAAAFTVQSTLPVGLCVHAAHTLLPTLLAILNTNAEEFAAVPTLTVRCSRPGCGAEFQLVPVQSSNGSRRRSQK
jgi:ribonuclease HI